ISSNANRFSTALERGYGSVGSITAAGRIPAVKLGIQRRVATGTRRDKTGSRTFAGVPAGVRRRTDYNLQTYLTSWDKTTPGPGYGPLFQAAMGGGPVVQRLLCGAGVDQVDIVLDGDYHEFHFSGVAKDVLDSASFESGAAQLQSVPA